MLMLTTRVGPDYGGPGRRHYRLYCILDNGTKAELAERGFRQPHIVVINGLVKELDFYAYTRQPRLTTESMRRLKPVAHPLAIRPIERREFVGEDACGLVDLGRGGARVLVHEQASVLAQPLQAASAFA